MHSQTRISINMLEMQRIARRRTEHARGVLENIVLQKNMSCNFWPACDRYHQARDAENHISVLIYEEQCMMVKDLGRTISQWEQS